MIRGYWKGYADGLQSLRAESTTDFERTLAILREELIDIRRDRDEQMARADAAADLLLQHLGTRAISLAGRREEQVNFERQLTNTKVINSITDPTDELPYGHPAATFKSASEASLFNGQDSE